MTVHYVTLTHLEDIARRHGLRLTVDGVKRLAYLRVGQTRYVAPMAEECAA